LKIRRLILQGERDFQRPGHVADVVIDDIVGWIKK
jgi:hypothetical protein